MRPACYALWLLATCRCCLCRRKDALSRAFLDELPCCWSGPPVVNDDRNNNA